MGLLKKIKFKSFTMCIFGLTIGAIVIATTYITTQNVSKLSINTLESNLKLTERLFTTILNEEYSTKDGLRLDEGVIVKGRVNLESVSGVFDKIQAMTGNIISLVRHTERVNISHKNSDLSKEIMEHSIDKEFLEDILNSTELNPIENKCFYRLVSIPSGKYYACYQPIFDSSTAKPIGFIEILTNYDVVQKEIRNTSIALTFIIILIGIAAFMLLILCNNFMEKNITIIKNVINKLGKGDFSEYEENNLFIEEFDSINQDLISAITNVRNIVFTNKNATQTLNYISSSIDEKSFEVLKISNENKDKTALIIENEVKQNDMIKLLNTAINNLDINVKESCDLHQNILQSIDCINSKISEGLEITNNLRDSVYESDNIAKNVTSVSSNLLNSIREIEELTLLIDVILKQTKLLSLNASIEAAKSKENSQGFSVIAGEMTILSNKCNEYTKTIKEKLKKLHPLLDSVDKAVLDNTRIADENNIHANSVYENISNYYTLANDINNTMINLSLKIKEINDSNIKLKSAAKNILSNSEESIKSSNEINEISIKQSNIINEVNSASSELLKINKQIQDDISKFKI